MVIVDTSVWIDFLEGKNKDKEQFKIFIELLNNEKVGLNSIIMAEILQGKKTEKQYQNTKNILDTFKLFIVTHNTIIKASKISMACQRIGETIKLTDCIIAASCIEYNL